MKMVGFYDYLFIFVLVLHATMFALGYDPSPLQDYCVAIESYKYNESVFVNGKFCKDPKLVKAEDFVFRGLNIPGNTNNTLGSYTTPVNVNQFPGLNTLGIAMTRIDYAPYGVNPPHINPRASEILVVMEGSLLSGFVTSDPDNKLYAKVLRKGDVMVFPFGLVHFQLNVGDGPALAFSGYSSQSPGLITIADAVFGSDPLIPIEVLTRAFQVDEKIIEAILQKFQ